MVKHILVPTDFGEPAERALELAIELAKRFEAKLTLLHVYTLPWLPYPTRLVFPMAELTTAAQRALDVVLTQARGRYDRCEGLVQGGSPDERIVRAAKDSGADLIVMGTHGRSGVSRFMLGSVAERVVRLSPIPVLTVAAKGAS
jgi:nucleotide-binding universal stress UspA family protein